jgi:hypothetical protein
MNTDFRDASGRHFGDGELLLTKSCFANADHLFGISAECSLKAVMASLGMATSKAGAPIDRGHKVHMPELWAAFQSFAHGRLASRYLEHLDKQNPFMDWKVDQRYWKRAAIPETAAKRHREAALQCQTSLERGFLDGVTI